MHNGISLRVRPISIHESLVLLCLKPEAVKELFQLCVWNGGVPGRNDGFLEWLCFPLGSTNVTLGGLTPLVEG